jgi:hypothetical protein
MGVDSADPRPMRHALALAAALSVLAGCGSSSRVETGDGAIAADATDAADTAMDAAEAPCAETLAAWCARGGHVCVARFQDAIAPGSPYCGAIFAAGWTDGGCGGFRYALVADTVDQVTKYVYDATGALVAVMDQTTIIESCLAGAAGVEPPRSCDDPRNDPATCCRPTGGGAISCGKDAGTDGG